MNIMIVIFLLVLVGEVFGGGELVAEIKCPRSFKTESTPEECQGILERSALLKGDNSESPIFNMAMHLDFVSDPSDGSAIKLSNEHTIGIEKPFLRRKKLTVRAERNDGKGKYTKVLSERSNVDTKNTYVTFQESELNSKDYLESIRHPEASDLVANTKNAIPKLQTEDLDLDQYVCIISTLKLQCHASVSITAPDTTKVAEIVDQRKLELTMQLDFMKDGTTEQIHGYISQEIAAREFGYKPPNEVNSKPPTAK